MRSLKFLLAFTVGVIRDPRPRRQFMFYGLIVALVLLFAGSTFLDISYPRRSVWVFVGYWAACIWLTFTALLLALYDMLTIRAGERRERRRLEREYLAEHGNEVPPNDEMPR